MTQQIEEKMQISQLLDGAIYECMLKKYGGQPEIILMHPVTFDKLLNDYKRLLSYFDSHNVGIIKYRGIKVVRSLDINEHEVQVY